MFNIKEKSILWGGQTLSLETGRVARQASGSVVVNYGGTSVLAAVVTDKSKESVDFLPLTVQFLARSYAIGKIPGGFLKREGKPSDREVLASRLIDRSIRPLFPSGFCNEVSVTCTLLSYSTIAPPEVVALVGAAAALSISGVPFYGPIAGARIGYLKEENKYLLNASVEDMSRSCLDLFLSGNESSVLMVESEAYELSEQQMLDAITFGHESCQPVVKLIKEFSDEVGIAPIEFIPHDISQVVSDIENSYKDDFIAVYSDVDKKSRVVKLDNLREKLYNELKLKYEASNLSYGDQDIVFAVKDFERSLIRSQVVNDLKRIDGRRVDEIRQIEIEVDVFQGAHGSALFTRGNTQALVITALGTPQDEQIVDDFDGDRREGFLLHYNFPPYAVGEASALRPPGRREIGHGKLAWRAIHPVLPEKADFPYTIRVVSEITESDGSSSMATVCGTSLALMDTGVPVKYPVAGIAMGLIKEKDEFVILSDILGDEDYLGDMDFKVAGTTQGITALQMDMKICGIDFNIIEKSLMQAREGRLYIIDKMNAVIQKPRESVKDHAPRIESVVIDKSKIRNVIGAGGKNIRDICDKTGAKIEIMQNGVVMIYSISSNAAEEAKEMIFNSVTEPEIGKVFDGIVDEIVKFGAFVNFLGNKRGLVHISEIKNEHINSVEDVLSVGDKVKVLVIDIDKDYVQLSMRRIDQDTGDIVECELYNPTKKGFSDDSSGNNFKDYGNRSERRRSSRSPSRRYSGGGYYANNEVSPGFGNNRPYSNSRHSDGTPKKPRFF